MDHETQSIHGVPMRPRLFARQEDLKCRYQIGCCAPVGILICQGQDPTFHRGRRCNFHRIVNQGADSLPLPMVRRWPAVAQFVCDRTFPKRVELGGLPSFTDLRIGTIA